MEKLKEMIENDRAEYKKHILARSRQGGKYLEESQYAYYALKNQIIEILMESGQCLRTGYKQISCDKAPQVILRCSWCQGQEKINKLLEGER